MSGRELPDPPAKASMPGCRAPSEEELGRRGCPVSPRAWAAPAKLLQGCTSARLRRDAPGHGQPSREGLPCSSQAARWGRTFILSLSHHLGSPCISLLPSGLVHGAGITQCNFHALDTNIFVWLLARHLNMSAVPSTDSCAVSSPPASIQTASWGCWLFLACL